jgi:hypothetical protein
MGWWLGNTTTSTAPPPARKASALMEHLLHALVHLFAQVGGMGVVGTWPVGGRERSTPGGRMLVEEVSSARRRWALSRHL